MATITVNSKKTNRSITIERELPNTLDEAVEAYGAEVVLKYFNDKFTVGIQNAARNVLNDAEQPDSAAIEAGLGFTPGVRTRGSGVSVQKAFQTVAEQIATGVLSLEDLQRMIEERQNQA